jgi:hypothetical protein
MSTQKAHSNWIATGVGTIQLNSQSKLEKKWQNGLTAISTAATIVA